MTEYITDSESWVDLRVGDKATVRGRLDGVLYGMPGHLVVGFADWTTLHIATDLPREARPIPLHSDVLVRVERTEDGLHALAIWMPGCPPIPLVSA